MRSPQLVAALAVSAEAELVKYETMKVESQMLTLAFIAAGGVLTYAAYSRSELGWICRETVSLE